MEMLKIQHLTKTYGEKKAVDDLSLHIRPGEIYTSSGTVSVLMAKGGAEVLHTTNSGKLITERAYDRKGDLYVFDEGASSIIVETSSGNLKIQ